MASSKSYTITLSNNKVEAEALAYLLAEDESFLLPDKAGRKQILEILQLDKSYARAFDLIMIKNRKRADTLALHITNPADITIIELKTTKKELPECPKGFFFGATENEFNLARKLGNQYKFCFVCLHPKTKKYKLLTLTELEKLIKTKRTQFQINL